MKIIELRTENIKRIKAIQIRPKDNTVIISGKNDQGKSSVIESIWLALDIATIKNDIPQPIRNGQNKSKVIINLGDIQVTRTWTQKGTYLKISPNSLVKKFGGSQSLLDSWKGKLSFDPMEFSRKTEKEQRDILLRLVSLDINLDEWKEQYQDIYDKRTEENRRLKELQIKINDIPINLLPKNTPVEEIDLEILTSEFTEGERVSNAQLKDFEILKNWTQELDVAEQKVIRCKNAIQTIKGQILSHKKIDIIELKEKMLRSNEINKNVRTLRAHTKMKDEQTFYENNLMVLNDNLNNMEIAKANAIKKASFPITGLSFSDEGVTFDNLPISQASTSQKIKISMSIAMALNPKLRVILIKDGDKLDKDNFALIQDIVKDKDYQLWIEKVDDSGELGIVIEDGEIKNNSDLCSVTDFLVQPMESVKSLINNKKEEEKPEDLNKKNDLWFS